MKQRAERLAEERRQIWKDAHETKCFGSSRHMLEMDESDDDYMAIEETPDRDVIFVPWPTVEEFERWLLEHDYQGYLDWQAYQQKQC